jgi:hypothetical protein
MFTDILYYTYLSRSALHSLYSVEKAVGEDLPRNTTSIITGNGSFFTVDLQDCQHIITII